MPDFTDHVADDHVAMIVRQGALLLATASDVGRMGVGPCSIDGTPVRSTDHYIAGDAAVRAED